MKKIPAFLSLLFVSLGTAMPVSAAPSGKGLIFGVNAGISPAIWFYNAYRVGVEAGFRFSKRFALVAEAGYGATTYKSSAGWQDSFSSSAKTTYASTPASLTIYYFAPVNDRLDVYLGIGGGYYSLSIKSTEEDHTQYGRVQTAEDTQNVNALAPHLCLGLECGLFKKVVMIGEVRQCAGKTKISTTDSYGFNNEQDVSFGGMQITIGIRIYLGGSDNS